MSTEALSDLQRPSEISLSSSEGCFSVIHQTRHEICKRIDQSYSSDELRTATFEMTTMRPLRDAVLGSKAPSLFYALLLNRIQFQVESNRDIAMQSLCETRASVCELLCIDLSSNYSKPEQAFQLIRLLTISYSPFNGCTPAMFEDQPTEEELAEMLELGNDNPANALEMAVLSEAKTFIATPIIQSILTAIYDGVITYLPLAQANALLSENYKQIGAEIYNPRDRPILDHYQLRVPKVRAVIETLNFLIMLLLFVAFHTSHPHMQISKWEVAFNIWTLSFALDEYAQHRNGSYFSDVWNALDFTYLTVWLAYLGLRIHGLIARDPATSDLALDTLVLGSVILLPRLVGSVIKRNIVILGVQSMFMAYLRFLVLAWIAASGFLFCFWTLADREKSLLHITWIMLRVWLGGYFITESEASSYHPVYGPVLMVVFALFSNSLLVTVLISILTDTFAKVQKNASQEFLFEKAVKTLERLKGDLLLEYIPPFNILSVPVTLITNFTACIDTQVPSALLIIGPAKLVLSPRALHSLHVFLVRVTAFPVLISLAAWYRLKDQLHAGRLALANGSEFVFDQLPQSMAIMDGGARAQRLAGKVFEKEVTSEVPPAPPRRPHVAAPAPPKQQSSSGLFNTIFGQITGDDAVSVPESLETRLQNVENSVNHIESMLSELLNQVARPNGESSS